MNRMPYENEMLNEQNKENQQPDEMRGERSPGAPFGGGNRCPHGFGPRGPMGPEGHGPHGFGPRGPMGPEGHGPHGFGPRGPMGPEGHGPHGFGPHGPMGPEGRGPHGFGPHGFGPGRTRPALRPGFVPEQERRARYESMTTDEKLTEQVRRLSHYLRMIPGTADGQRRVLSILLEKGPLSQRELMELAGIRSASMSELVGKLEAGGYVVRFPHPKDHRSMTVALTEAGVAAAERFNTQDTALYAHMTDAEKEGLLNTLETLSDHWRALVPGMPMEQVKA